MPTTPIDSITADVLHAVIHDLKGPAGRLRMLSELLRRETALNEDALRLLGHIQDSAAAVGEVANGLRAYVEVCDRPPVRETVDLNQALASAMANLRAELDSTGAEVTSSILPHVQADSFLMTWLFQELLTNAVRFRAADAPRVTVSAGEGGPGRSYISVLDNGPGIESGQVERAFRPFKKLCGGPGAGLGLTICRKIVEMHGGRIWVEPGLGGADFRFFVGKAGL